MKLNGETETHIDGIVGQPFRLNQQIFGFNLISDYPFSENLNKCFNYLGPKKLPTMYFACNQFPPFAVNWSEGKLIFSQEYAEADGDRCDSLYHFNHYDVFRIGGIADFYIRLDRIDCHLHNVAHQSWVELLLLGQALPIWLERKGILTLHASAVVMDERIIAFPSHSGNGKSTLAAALLQAGAALLTDDILVIEELACQFWGRPGLPQINLWPDQVAYFMDNEEYKKVVSNMPKKHVPVERLKKAAFCQESQPLACIYIPNRRDLSASESDIKITSIPLAEAVIELVRYSFITPTIAEKMGWQASRLDFFARLVKRVPVRRLLYPAGFDHLPRVTEAVLRDMEKLPSR